jgi:prevent-host-death family protein
MKYVSVSDARRNLASLVDQVERTIVVRNNKPVAAILHMDDFEALLSAQARARDPERVLRLLEARREVEEGRPGATVDFSRGSAEELLDLAREAPARPAKNMSRKRSKTR